MPFSMHFLICNIFISAIIGFVLLIKKAFGRHLSGRIKYSLWCLLFILLIVPFISIRPSEGSLSDFLFSFKNNSPVTGISSLTQAVNPLSTTEWMENFSISVTRETPSILCYLPSAIWILGILVMILLMIRSRFLLYRIEKSALPLQNQTVKALYWKCRQEIGIKQKIPVYSTAFLKSPVMVGFFSPRIYLPIHLISDLNIIDMRYMLLHELQHYKHKDALVNHLLNFTIVIYWFNPLIWYLLKEVRTDREIACDSSVLQILDRDDYITYGHTLLNFAEKTSLSPFTLATQMGGSTLQIKKRILNIVSYRPETMRHKVKGYIIFLVIGILIWESTAFVPVLAAQAHFSLPQNATIIEEDLSSYFTEQNGSFVLYDLNADTWQIYNKTLSEQRISPASTYKIYSSLFALENQYITPTDSTIAWNGQTWPFPEWNQDQTLSSAMQNSVNWYFQTLDQQAGLTALEKFYESLEYGNHDLSGGISEFYLESSLKISPLEQVVLLKKLFTNELPFDKQNMQTVKNALLRSSSQGISIYGKTGTGAVNNQNINGWFIGCLEAKGNSYFFATNIQGDSNADGKTASQITLSILQSKGLY